MSENEVLTPDSFPGSDVDQSFLGNTYVEFMAEMSSVLEEPKEVSQEFTPEQKHLILGVLGKLAHIFSDGLPRDTESPPALPTHGWLEQYAVFEANSLADLETLVLAGLTDEENDQLIKVAAKLITLAQLKDDKALDNLTGMV